MKKAIIIGSLAPIVLYILFSIIIVGIVGLSNFEALGPNERIATIALGVYSHPVMNVFANVLAVLAMFTSFLTIGIALVEVYHYDYGISRKKSLLLAFSIPLLIVVFKLSSFIAVLGITGAIAGGLDGILVVLAFWKAKILGDRKPEYSMGKHYFLGGLLILLFLSGMIYTFL